MRKSSRLIKLENNRFSIFTDDLSKCILCGRDKIDLHEILYGKNRLNSIKYGYVIPLCRNCHQKIHNDRSMTLYWIKKCQRDYEVVHSREDWISTFKRNYL